jgi:hypothetical protein
MTGIPQEKELVSNAEELCADVGDLYTQNSAWFS